MEQFDENKDYLVDDKRTKVRNFKAYLRTLTQKELCNKLANVADSSPYKINRYDSVMDAVVTLTYGEEKETI